MSLGSYTGKEGESATNGCVGAMSGAAASSIAVVTGGLSDTARW